MEQLTDIILLLWLTAHEPHKKDSQLCLISFALFPLVPSNEK
jgi:hypothetical protein